MRLYDYNSSTKTRDSQPSSNLKVTSFSLPETGSRTSSLPPESRFVARHEPVGTSKAVFQKDEAEMDPAESGALQFAPAYCESNAAAQTNKTPKSARVSWDAILTPQDGLEEETSMSSLEEKKESAEPVLHNNASSSSGKWHRKLGSNGNMSILSFQKNKQQTLSSKVSSAVDEESWGPVPNGSRMAVAATGSNVSNNSSRSGSLSKENRVPKNFNTRFKGQDGIATASCMKQPQIIRRKGSGRIGRIASSLFSNRSSVGSKDGSVAKNSYTNTTTSSPASAPNSPTCSSSSGGYVGWPGTEDKLGVTLPTSVPSSYDDSSAGGPTSGQELQPTRSQKFYQEKLGEKKQNAGVVSLKQRSSDGQYVRAEDLNNGPESKSNNMSGPMESPADLTAANAVAASKKSMTSMPYPRSKMEQNAAGHFGFRGAKFASGVRQQHRVSSRLASLKCGKNLVSDRFEPASRPDVSPGGISSCADSKTSSAYLDVNEMGQLSYPTFDRRSKEKAEQVLAPFSGPQHTALLTANAVLRPKPGTVPVTATSISSKVVAPSHIQPPTVTALAKAEHLSPQHRAFSSSKGDRSLLDKTKDVPCLMDLDSDSCANLSPITTTTVQNAVVSNVHNAAEFGLPDLNHALRPADRRQFTPHNKLLASVNEDSESDVFDNISVSNQSDVFDNLSPYQPHSRQHVSQQEIIAEEEDNEFDNITKPHKVARDLKGDEENGDGFKLVRIGGGLTAIQSTPSGFSNRQTASDYDDQLTNSDLDQNGFARLPNFKEMTRKGQEKDSALRGIHGNLGVPKKKDVNRVGFDQDDSDNSTKSGTDGSYNSSFFSDPYSTEDTGYNENSDLLQYFVSYSTMKKVVRRYRQFSQIVALNADTRTAKQVEDETKTFALHEMRSRIMENDIGRGLERRGGTVVVDDLVTTSYARKCSRVRDAVIVSKAWRDGANPKDVISTARLTQRMNQYYIKRSPYSWEPVRWVDDIDFMQYKSPSLGPRNLRGFEIFTIGDCQSILLKLTNDNCVEHRRELNRATKRQLEAEELMRQEEGDDSKSLHSWDMDMTDAEIAYLSAMEEVKSTSKKLVVAEKAFTLVRNRIENLVSKYAAMIVKIETGSDFAPSSILTTDSSYYEGSEFSHQQAKEEEYKGERIAWARRAERAELKAQVAAREAMLAKQEVQTIQKEKQLELEDLQRRLEELQSESSFTTKTSRDEHQQARSVILTKSLAMGGYPSLSRNDNGQNQISVPDDKVKIEEVKRRFRDRIATRTKLPLPRPPPTIAETDTLPAGKRQEDRKSLPPVHPARLSSTSRIAKEARNLLIRSAGEEMCLQLDFYERSLKAVNETRLED